MIINGIIAEYNPFHNGHLYQIADSKRASSYILAQNIGDNVGNNDYINTHCDGSTVAFSPEGSVTSNTASCGSGTVDGTHDVFTVVLMSGNYVQRGIPAIIDKHTRTRIALENGADLVLELPIEYSTASAEYFAHGGVGILNALGVDRLCFGSECGDVDAIQRVANILCEESDDFKMILKQEMSKGASFPKAREKAVLECLKEHIRDCAIDCDQAAANHDISAEANTLKSVLSSANNILAIEYCKALTRLGSSIVPYTTTRQGSGYNDSELQGEFGSATAIREELYRIFDCIFDTSNRSSVSVADDLDSTNGTNKNSLSLSPLLAPYLPASELNLLEDYFTKYEPISADDFSSMLYYKLLSLQDVGYTEFLDVSEDLSNKIRKNIANFTTFTAFCELLKSKELTYSRISRCLLHILLNIKQYPIQPLPGYVRVLGFRRDASKLLSELGKRSKITLLSKPADAERILSEEDLKHFKQNMFADALYEQVRAGKSSTAPMNEYTTPICIV